MRIIATTAFFALLTTFAYGQKEVDLTSNPILEIYHADEQRALGIFSDDTFTTRPKTTCYTPSDPQAIPVLNGQTVQFQLELDTIGFGADGYYECIDCVDAVFGTAGIVLDQEGEPTDSLFYTANMGVAADTDLAGIRYCNADGSACTDIETFVFLARRPGANDYPPAIPLQPEEVIDLDIPLSLPGELTCNFFVDCPDNYEGREQLAYFTDYSGPVNSIVYRASRVDGLDSLCVVLCDDNGICDTTHYAFRVQVNSITPPFYDDFSYDNPVPVAGLWLDKEVYVNKEMPFNPPSIGVATFDGLSNRGRPYGDGYGPADRLTSTYLNTINGNWTLSFWLQRGGIADRPEVQDSLVLQFRDEEDDWISIMSFEGMAANQPFSVRDSFQFYSAPVSADYQHDRFQFRFINYNDRTGFRDNWHLDYVRLDNNPTGSEDFNDIAFTYPPDYILENYTSMPWRHFQPQLNEELRTNIDIGVYNHFATDQNASPSFASIEELNTGINPFGAVPTLFNGLESNVAAQESILRTYSLQGDPTGFSNVYDNYAAQMGSSDFNNLDDIDFRLSYSLTNTSQEGLDFVQRNDEVSRITHFGEYFAYDDGTAESAIQTSANRQVAVAYTASVADTIHGVQMHFANTNDGFPDQQFRLRIWIGELDGTPEYSQIYEPVFPSAFFDTLQGFTSYRLLDENGDLAPLAIPAGTFYVGWQQASSCDFSECISIGYDRNRPQAKAFIFADNGAGFNPVSGITEGALMLRPYLNSEIGVTSVESLQDTRTVDLKLFPNPVRDQLFLKTNMEDQQNTQLIIYNATGQEVFRQSFAEVVNISTLSAGIYFAQLQGIDGNQSAPQRLIVIK
ncbi:T9SS type A sorting domain-containing protein [Lewinella cohaerens]|uniref:T9SS type A sorting domain-containing protein n=1 Tax=Lewinella cohaerens TaxID=70995 RepID=UPI0003664CDD|nr:T9SS type A sorting domain-containing protein [Lewinella cohaerens]